MPNWNMYGNISDILLTDEDVDDAFKTCVIQGYADATSDFSGGTGTRIGSVFVILVVSTFVTLLPIIMQKFKWKMSVWFYMFARFFGAGVIIATAFVHLMDPAYGEIGGLSCVGMWGNWASYSWVPALILLSVFTMFFVDLISEVYVERKWGVDAELPDIQGMLTGKVAAPNEQTDAQAVETAEGANCENVCCDESMYKKEVSEEYADTISSADTVAQFKSQFTAFLVLEMGVIFHSVIIGLNLGSTGYDDFKTLYIVLVFHQSFEGLGIGARLSAIPWPKSKPEWIKYALCIAYGLVTPVSVAIGIGVRKTYVAGSFTANIVSGVLDSLSCGILIYTGMIELLARDFIFNKEFRKNLTHLSYSCVCLVFGAGIMALVGKWA